MPFLIGVRSPVSLQNHVEQLDRMLYEISLQMALSSIANPGRVYVLTVILQILQISIHMIAKSRLVLSHRQSRSQGILSYWDGNEKDLGMRLTNMTGGPNDKGPGGGDEAVS